MGSRRPFFVQQVMVEHPEKEVQVFFQDETRFGQKGGRSRVWAKRGSHPERVRACGFLCSYLLGAVNPLSGQRVGLIFETLNTEVMNLFLKMLREEVDTQVHIVLVLDQAGWHASKELVIPQEMTFLPLPPYSPQLNPIERLWKSMKESNFHHVVEETLDQIMEAGCQAWQKLTDGLIKSLCSSSWLSRIFN